MVRSTKQKLPNLHQYLTLFTDNHDNPRFLHDQPDVKLYENAICYTLTATGISILYYGSGSYFFRVFLFNFTEYFLQRFQDDFFLRYGKEIVFKFCSILMDSYIFHSCTSN
jgi:glycosidase